MEKDNSNNSPITVSENQQIQSTPMAVPPQAIGPQVAAKPKIATWKKTLMIIGGIALGVILLVVIIIFIVSVNSKKFECTSSQGDITIMYGDDTINGYLANGMSYDLDEQKSYAESIGIEKYLSEFNDWFESNTDGTCVKK